jgi:NADPH2:quinone reductase
MRAVICERIGSVGDLSVVESPTPDPDPNQVCVEVKAAGASYVDALTVSGRYQFPLTPPYVPGGECAGVVQAVGANVQGWQVGDRVFASTGIGAFASHLLASPHQLTRLPDSVDFARGASFLQVYGTAWFAFHERTVLRAGEVVLVTGAAGGVGLAAIDVARSIGARVLAVASTDEKRRLALAAGAHAAIDSADDVKARARELTDGKGVDVVYDVTGGDVAEQALRALRFDGRYLVIGFTAGIAKVPMNLVLLNNRAMIGVEWGGWIPRNVERNKQMIADIVAAIDSGRLTPLAPFERPLDHAPAVLAELLERRAVGKIALIP